ncbi:MAG: tetratricopeptide repeat protein [Endomicrobiales bacterium]|nr:tetratricopeptide repeat protein [Endomicrobiales bacterium]
MKIMKFETAVVLGLFFVFASSGHCSSSENADIERLLECGEFAAAQNRIERFEDDRERAYWKSKELFYRGDYRGAFDEMNGVLGSEKGEEKWIYFRDYCALVWNSIKDHEAFLSEHFVIKARDEDVILADYALDALEKAYEKIGGSLGVFPEDRVTVEIYPDKESFAIASTLGMKTLEKSGTVGICKFNRIMMISPRALPLGFAWQDTLAHEYTHFLINRKSAGMCPLWLHEGIARYFETTWRLDKPYFISQSAENLIVKAVKNKSFISFKRMHPSMVYLKDRDEISLAFGEVAYSVDYVIKEYGKKKIGELLGEMPSGGVDGAFSKTLSVSQRKFEKNFFRYLASLDLALSEGSMNDQPDYSRKDEEAFIGADLAGTVRLGDRMRRIKRFDAAVEHYQEALESEPSNPVILLKKSKALVMLGRYEEAADALEAAISDNPGYVTLYETLGGVYFARKDYGKSAKVFLGAVAINPYNPETHRFLWQCYLAKNDNAKALNEMRIELILDPGDFQTRILYEKMKSQ